MKIRSEQMTAFEQAAIQNFRQRMSRHLQEAFPKHCRILGEARLENMIDLGWKKAESYGLTGENSIILVTELMFLLGSSFDTDPQLQWAAEILSSENPQDESTRTQALYDKAIEYLDRVSGEQNEHIDAAQVRLRDEQPDNFAASDISTPGEDLLLRLRHLFPEKYGHVGEAWLQRLIEQGVEEANNYGITDGRGIAVYIRSEEHTSALQ